MSILLAVIGAIAWLGIGIVVATYPEVEGIWRVYAFALPFALALSHLATIFIEVD